MKNFKDKVLDFQLRATTQKHEFYRFIKQYIFGKKIGIKRKSRLSKLVSILIPVPGENLQTNSPEQYHYYIAGLKKLLFDYLPSQTYKNYEGIIYCDGPNKEIKSLVNGLADTRLKVYAMNKRTGLFGHPQTRQGIIISKGDFFVRMNCDNQPYPEYLDVLVSGFNGDGDLGAVYGRIIFKGAARQFYKPIFLNDFKGIPNEMKAFIIPRDRQGVLKFSNIDCMNYMVRTDLARKYINAWTDEFETDWFFISRLLQAGIKVKFVDRLIGVKL